MRCAVALPLWAFTALVGRVVAQTYTSCNPLKATCPSDPALGTSFNQTFGTSSSLDPAYWTIDAGPDNTFSSDGAAFTITQHGDSPTIQTPYYIFWGRVEVIMKAAAGQGIISSIVLLTDDLDEIDWEIMGGNTSFVETNYYGKGNTNESNAIYYPCNGPQESFHNYTTVWSSEQIEWHLDGNIVRTLPYGEAVFQGATSYPQTPAYLKIGSWAGGDPTEPPGTIAWAGGTTNFAEGPFVMTVQSVTVTDGTQGAMSYSYNGHSGSWQSIAITQGVSSVNQRIHEPPPQTLSQRWAGLSTTARIGIIVGIAVAAVVILALLSFCCVKQRRRGRQERITEDERMESEMQKQSQFRQDWNQSSTGFVNAAQPTPTYTSASYPLAEQKPAVYSTPAAYATPAAYSNKAYSPGGYSSPAAYSSAGSGYSNAGSGYFDTRNAYPNGSGYSTPAYNNRPFVNSGIPQAGYNRQNSYGRMSEY